MPSLTRKIAMGTAIYSIGNFLDNFFRFLTIIFLIRALGKSDYGLLVLTLSVFSIVTTFLDLDTVKLRLVPSEIARYRSENPKIAKSLVREFAFQQIFFGLLIGIALIFSTLFIKEKYGEVVARLTLFVSAMIVGKSAFNILIATFYGHSRFKLHQGMEITLSMLRALLALVVMTLGKGLFAAMTIYPVSLFVSVILFLPFFQRIISKIPKNYESKGILLRIYRSHGKFVLAGVPLTKLNSEAPIWIIQYLLGVEAVAIFSVARKVYVFLRDLLNPLNRVLFPVLSEISSMNIVKMHKVMERGVKYLGIASLIFLISAFILITPFFKIAFQGYSEAVPLAKFLLLILLLRPLIVILEPSLYALQGQKYLFLSKLYTTPVHLSLFILLTYYFGLMGSAIGEFLFPMFLVILQYHYLTKLDFSMSLSLKEIIKIDEYDKNLFKKVYKSIRGKI
jgi:O-antigen/teichoic acid export membrane protein